MTFIKTKKSYWADIESAYDELEGVESKDDKVKCICIDAWRTDDINETGCVIAKVFLTKTGDSGVIYIDNLARSDPKAQEVIQEVLRKIKE